MNQRFEKIPVMEQRRIRTAALEEFADKGFHRASTNAIVKAAGIPKGTLFYYFGSKEGLFLDLVDHAVLSYISYVESEKSKPPAELFERLLYREGVKTRFAAQYPLLFRFLSKALLDIPENVGAQMAEKFEDYRRASAVDLMDGLERDRFRPDIEVESAVKMIHVLLEGVFAQYAGRLKNAAPEEFNALYQRISEECRSYFRMIQSGIYR